MTHIALLLLAFIGAGILLQLAQQTYEYLLFHFIPSSHPLQAYRRPGTPGAHALITGASAGIGLGIAQELVRQNFGVILHGHRPDELAVAAVSLRNIRPGASVHVRVLDARSATPEEMEELVSSISHLNVSILVNNVGGNPAAEPAIREFRTYSCDDVDAVINQNARFMARLTALMLPVLAKRREGVVDGEEKSLILSMSSAGMHGLPWLQMYGATKAFNWGLSVGLARELETSNETRHVDALCVVPGEVKSQGNCRGVPDKAPTADAFGKMVVQKVDRAVQLGWREMRPDWRHDLQIALLTRLPEGTRTMGVTEQAKAKKDAWTEWWEKNH
ncbi:hypothetical protein OQA88_2906 [Cercophora sp. LCS_1]